jgi:manganese-dependent inorganic pyrophosphatase
MATPVLIVGHKNPDNDSIAGAVGFAYYKNEMMKRTLAQNPDAEEFEYIPCRLGPLPEESEAILSEYGIEAPQLISHVYARVCDVMTSPVISLPGSATLLQASQLLAVHDIRSIVVTDENGKYAGVVSSRTIAERYISTVCKGAKDATEESASMIAADLQASLTQDIMSLVDNRPMIVAPNDLYNDVFEDLMANELREAVVLDEEGVAVGIVTRSDVAVKPRRKVALVDHNEFSQAADGLHEAEIVEIVDHHRIGDVCTNQPIRFTNMPVGSSATIITCKLRNAGIDIPEGIAATLLSAILTDTVILKSPTATEVDREQVEYLAGIIGQDPTEFGLHVFNARGGDAEMDVKTLVTADSKEFKIPEGTILIAQHETVTLDTVMQREEEIREFLRDLKEKNSYEFVLLLVTDIIAEGSNFLVEGDHKKVDKVFGINSSKAVWMPGVLSRKKQVAAPLLEA